MSSSQISDVRDENACPGRTEAPIGMDLSEERELAAVITRLREALEVQQQGKRVLESLAMRKWTRDATHRKKSEFLLPFHLAHPSSTTSLETKRQNLVETEQLFQWRCTDHDSRVKKVDEKFNVTNTWNATFVEPAHGDVSLSLSFIAVTKERGKSQRINAVDFSLIEQDSVSENDRGLLVLDPEVRYIRDQTAAKLSEVFRLSSSYLSKSRQRLEVLRGENKKAAGSRGLDVIFNNDHGVFLVRMEWIIKLKDGNDWSSEYKLTFSEEGRKAARDLHFPRSLRNGGHCSDWSPEYCAENLRKMAALDETRPAKKSRESVSDTA